MRSYLEELKAFGKRHSRFAQGTEKLETNRRDPETVCGNFGQIQLTQWTTQQKGMAASLTYPAVEESMCSEAVKPYKTEVVKRRMVVKTSGC